MFDSIASLAALAVCVVAFVIVVAFIWKNDVYIWRREPPCDFDCDRCPFPPCGKEQIERWKQYDIHNGRLPR